MRGGRVAKGPASAFKPVRRLVGGRPIQSLKLSYLSLKKCARKSKQTMFLFFKSEGAYLLHSYIYNLP